MKHCKPKDDMDVFSRATRMTISMPAFLYSDAQIRRRQKRFASFSDYIQDLIRADTEGLEKAAAA